MKVLSENPDKSELRDSALEWISLLRGGQFSDYQEAWDFLFHPEDEYWTLQLMKDSIQTYGAPQDYDDDEVFLVTEVDEEVPINIVIPEPGVEGAVVEIDLPLNGEISDLTAQLTVCRISGGFTFTLSDIHVL
jgi:hypothetical protein